MRRPSSGQILLVSSGPHGTVEARLLDKLARSAEIPADSLLSADIRDKAAAWAAMKSRRPRVVVALGAEAARTLLRVKSLSLSTVVGMPHRVDYLPDDAAVVPLYDMTYVLNRGREVVDECVRILARCHAYANGGKPC